MAISASTLRIVDNTPSSDLSMNASLKLNSNLPSASRVLSSVSASTIQESNLIYEENETVPVQIFITDTNKRNKSRALVRKLVRFASKATQLVTAAADDENAIQIASFEIPRK